MIQRFVLSLALAAAWLGAVPAAAHDAGLQTCAKIVSVLDRLDCYDALARSERDAAATTPAGTVPAVPPAPAPAPAPAATPARAPVPAPPAAPAAVAADEAEGFGFEERRMHETPDEIRSRYDGAFAGWNGKTVFKLENGQVWKQAEKGRMVHRAERPLITIRKGLFGSFRLSVEGVNKSVRVERIK